MGMGLLGFFIFGSLVWDVIQKESSIEIIEIISSALEMKQHNWKEEKSILWKSERKIQDEDKQWDRSCVKAIWLALTLGHPWVGFNGLVVLGLLKVRRRWLSTNVPYWSRWDFTVW